jgi:hypothetical protein
MLESPNLQFVEVVALYTRTYRAHICNLLATIIYFYVRSYHAKSKDHGAPEEDVVQQCPAPNPPASLDHDNGHL